MAQAVRAEPQSLTTAAATVASLVAHGIDTMYALPGVHNDHLFEALHQASDAIRVVHSRHEQGAAYMALGAALASNRPQTYAVVPGPGLLNTSAALLMAYSMNAPVLALIGQIPDADIGRGLGHLHEIRDQAGIITRLVDFSDRIRGPEAASRLVAQAMRSMGSGRTGPAALECAIDVWGRTGHVTLEAPLPFPEVAIDDDAIAAAAKRLGAAKRPMIICGGGAQGAAHEITQLSAMLQAPVLGYRRGRGVLDSRDPLSVTLPLGHELWAEADVVLAVGTHLLMQLRQWGIDENLAVIRVDADPEEPARLRTPEVTLIGDATPILRRLVDAVGRHNIARPSRTDEMEERQSRWTKRLTKLGP
jgi:acetolactate synthase I/II/III large subunit